MRPKNILHHKILFLHLLLQIPYVEAIWHDWANAGIAIPHGGDVASRTADSAF